MAPEKPSDRDSSRRPRYTTPHHPLCMPVGSSSASGSGSSQQAGSKMSLMASYKHYTTCGTYYGGPFSDPVGPPKPCYTCTCSKHGPHRCCLSMSEYVSLTVDQLVRRRQNDCRTQLFINKVADPYAKAPPQETGPETHVAAMDIDPASHDEPIIKSEPNDNFEVAAVPVVHEGGADVNTMDTDMDMADMDLEIVDMEDIPLSDPIDEIIEREYDFVPEFPEEGDSDMDFDVPSPKELSAASQPLEPARPLAWPWTTLTSYARHQNQTALGRVGRFF